MPRGELPAPVRRFLLTSVPSVPWLEAVLLLRAEPQRTWDAPMLARRLFVDEEAAAELLASLEARGVTGLSSEQRHQYAPSPDLAALLDQAAEAYASDLIGVTDLIHSRIDKRARRFSDAFRFRKE